MARPLKVEFGREGWMPHLMFEWRSYDGAIGFWEHPKGKPWLYLHRDYYDGEIVALWVGPFTVCLRY